jgi:hypothetical protein
MRARGGISALLDLLLKKLGCLQHCDSQKAPRWDPSANKRLCAVVRSLSLFDANRIPIKKSQKSECASGKA